MAAIKRTIGGIAIPIVAMGILLGTECPNQQVPAPGNGGGEPTVSVSLVEVADGLTAPVELVSAGDESGRLFVVDQVGTIRVINADGDLLPTPFLDVTDRMVTLANPGFDERGLLSVAFHPDYSDNGRFFVYYSAPPDSDDPAGFDSESRVSEFRVMANDINRADPNSESVLLDINQPQANHNGGQLAFGPDGMLYIGTGDGGAANDRGLGHTDDIGNGQDRSKLLGKILRIDVDGATPYAVPDDNPFVGEQNALPEIWAWGFRNPWRFSFDRGGERRLFVADVGQNLFEEVSLIASGDNAGWNVREGSSCFNPDNSRVALDDCASNGSDGEPFVAPIISQPQVEPDGTAIGLSIIGGHVVRGGPLAAFDGQYVFAQWSTQFAVGDGSLYAAAEDTDGNWTVQAVGVNGRTGNRLGEYVLALGLDESGNIYLLTSENFGPFGQTGRVYRIEP